MYPRAPTGRAKDPQPRAAIRSILLLGREGSRIVQYLDQYAAEAFQYVSHLDVRVWVPAMLVAATIGVFCMRGVGR